MPHCLYCHAPVNEDQTWPIFWDGRRVYPSNEEGRELLVACSERHAESAQRILEDAESKRGAFVFGMISATVIYPLLAVAGYSFFRGLFDGMGLYEAYTRRDHGIFVLFLFCIDWGAGLLLYPYPTNEPGAALGLVRSTRLFRILGALLLTAGVAFYLTWTLWEV